MTSDERMVNATMDALKKHFRAVITASAGKPFEETKVVMPSDGVWRGYAEAAVDALLVALDEIEQKAAESWHA